MHRLTVCCARTYTIGILGDTVRHFEVMTNPSSATNKNWQNVMVLPAPGSDLWDKNNVSTELGRAPF